MDASRLAEQINEEFQLDRTAQVFIAMRGDLIEVDGAEVDSDGDLVIRPDLNVTLESDRGPGQDPALHAELRALRKVRLAVLAMAERSRNRLPAEHADAAVVPVEKLLRACELPA